MERISLTDTTLEEAAKRAAEVLKRGGILLYPTATLYGLGADALSNDAVDRVYRIKARDLKKPMHSIVLDLDMAARYGEIDGRARALAHVEGPVSIVVAKRAACTRGICRSLDTFGFRVALHPFCVALTRAFGEPVTTTSANRAGHLPERSVEAILEQLGDTARYIDLIIDAGPMPESAPSSLVDLSRGEPEILREGAVPADAIWRALRR